MLETLQNVVRTRLKVLVQPIVGQSVHDMTGNGVTIRFALPSAELAPYVTTYYYSETRTSYKTSWLEDYLHPEWSNLRFLTEGASQAAIGSGDLADCPCFAITGPTSMATRFRNRSGRSWGIGLLPLGWAKFMGVPAGDYADRYVDGLVDPNFEHFAPLARQLAASDGNFDSELTLIENYMSSLASCPVRQVAEISAVNRALVDSSVSSVAQLAEEAGLTIRTLERLAHRTFGFTPKLLLRRQRFLRSLAQFMLDPSMKWLSAIDFQYHDQAHFVRDFKRFMGMSPSAYGKLDHPFLRAAAQARAAITGAAVQGLHDPQVPHIPLKEPQHKGFA